VCNYLLRLARSAPVKAGGRSYDEQYAWLRERTDPASSFERSFLDHFTKESSGFPISPNTPQRPIYSFNPISTISAVRSPGCACSSTDRLTQGKRRRTAEPANLLKIGDTASS